MDGSQHAVLLVCSDGSLVTVGESNLRRLTSEGFPHQRLEEADSAARETDAHPKDDGGTTRNFAENGRQL